MDRGAECFDFNKDLNLLVSGSADHLVRLWNPYCVAKPTTLLGGHLTGVSAVSIAAADEGMAKVYGRNK